MTEVTAMTSCTSDNLIHVALQIIVFVLAIILILQLSYLPPLVALGLK